MPETRTTYLGQYEHETAEKIAAELVDAGIVWWHKQAGPFMRTIFAGDWGVRMFVEEARLEEAQVIADRVTGANA